MATPKCLHVFSRTRAPSTIPIGHFVPDCLSPSRRQSWIMGSKNRAMDRNEEGGSRNDDLCILTKQIRASVVDAYYPFVSGLNCELFLVDSSLI